MEIRSISNIWSISTLDQSSLRKIIEFYFRKVNCIYDSKLSLDCSYVVLNFWPNLSLVVLIKLFYKACTSTTMPASNRRTSGLVIVLLDIIMGCCGFNMQICSRLSFPCLTHR